MPKKKIETPKNGDEKPTKILVQPRKPGEWMQMLKAAEKDHFRRLQVTIQIREWLMAGKPAQLDAAKAMLKARGLEDQIEAVPIDDPNARAAEAEKVQDEGLCEFFRREGKPGIWMPTNNLKAMLKENWSVLGYNMEARGSRGGIREGVFVYSIHPEGTPNVEKDWIYLGEEPAGVHTAVSHSVGPSGPVSAIKRHEYIVRPRLTFEIAIERGNVMEKLPDEAMARTLFHAQEHGLGACRSQGYGRFDVLDIVEIDAPNVSEEKKTADGANKPATQGVAPRAEA